MELGCEVEGAAAGGVETVLGRRLFLRAPREIEQGDEASAVEREIEGLCKSKR